MTPALRSELEGLRKTILAVPDDVARGKTPAAIVTVLERTGREMSPREVFKTLTCAGREVTEDAVYQACKRLADAGTIERPKSGRYKAKGATS